MKENLHGILSILLITAALAAGLYQVWMHSTAMGVVYLAIILISTPVMVYAYCSKCECRENNCRHVFVGKMTRFLPARKNTAYTFLDYLGLVVPFAALFGFPQYWLWKAPVMWIIFSVLPVAAGIELLLFVCKDCGNTKCAICVRRNGLSIQSDRASS